MEGHSPCEHRALSEAQRGLARVPLPLRRRALPGNGEPRPARFSRGAAAPGRRQGGRAGRCPGGSGGEAQHPRPRGCCQARPAVPSPPGRLPGPGRAGRARSTHGRPCELGGGPGRRGGVLDSVHGLVCEEGRQSPLAPLPLFGRAQCPAAFICF